MSELATLNERIVSLERRVAELEERLRSEPDGLHRKGGKELTIREFILSKRPSNDVEKTLAIGYFLETCAGAASFNVEDLAQNFVLAKEAIPLNINDKVNLNIKKGHMAEARAKKDKKKAWRLTNSGEKFVENGFKDSTK